MSGTAPLAVGCDVVSLAEIQSSLDAFGERFLRRVFTPQELADCVGPDQVSRLAARFAAKEAAVKALAITDSATPPRDIETVLDGPLPRLVLHRRIAARAETLGYNYVVVSLSHSDCHAMAVVACARVGSLPGQSQ